MIPNSIFICLYGLFHSAWCPQVSSMLLQMAVCPSSHGQIIFLCVYYIHHSFFIHSFITGHLHCFYILAIVNNAAMIRTVQIPLWYRFSLHLDKYPEIELPGHMVVLLLIFQETSVLSSTMSTSIHIPTNSGQWFPFGTSSPTVVNYCLILNNVIHLLSSLPLSNRKKEVHGSGKYILARHFIISSVPSHPLILSSYLEVGTITPKPILLLREVRFRG